MSFGAIIAIIVALVVAIWLAMANSGPKVTTIETKRVSDDDGKDGDDA